MEIPALSIDAVVVDCDDGARPPLEDEELLGVLVAKQSSRRFLKASFWWHQTRFSTQGRVGMVAAEAEALLAG